MPESWEKDLRRLRRIEPPASLEGRVHEGPRFEPGRSTRERVTAAVVAFAVSAAVGVAGFQALRSEDTPVRRAGSGDGVPDPGSSIVVELSSDAVGPTATIRYGDREQRAVFEGATWCPDGELPPAASGGTGGSASSCTSYIADFAFYPPVNDFLVVPPGTPIEVVGPATILETLVTDPNGEPVLAATEVLDAAPSDDGMYAFDVHAEWPQGTGDFFFGIQTLGDPAGAPDVLTLDCSSFAARLDTAVVRTQPDGLHLRIVGDTHGFAIGVPGPDGTGLPDAAIGGTERGTIGIDPGRWGIKCGRDGAVESLLAPFELIDPDDHHAPEQLTCTAGSGSTFGSSVPTSTSHANVIGQLLTGLAEGDRIRGAGYGAETWRLGPTYVVDRGGEAVARVVLDGEGGAWTGTLDVCDDSGIDLSDAASSGASSPSAAASDVLRVRCERFGPALDSAVVRRTDGGIRVEAINVADAAQVAFEKDDGTPLPAVLFEEATATKILDLEPGIYWVGCIVSGEDGAATATERAVHPEWFARFEVLPGGSA